LLFYYKNDVFLLVNYNPSVFYGHENTRSLPRNLCKILSFWSYVTIELRIYGFLLVVHCNYASNLHSYGDIKSQSSIWPC